MGPSNRTLCSSDAGTGLSGESEKSASTTSIGSVPSTAGPPAAAAAERAIQPFFSSKKSGCSAMQP